MSAHEGKPTKAPVEIFRKDYKQPDYWVHEVELVVKIYEESAQILSTLRVKRNEGAPANAPLVLDGENLELARISLDGEVLPVDRYSWVEEDVLHVKGPLPSEFKLACEVSVKPHLNTQLSGLYKSGGVYSTQCEAEGFRRITLMQDRPDVMASYTSVRIEACKKACPVLLSNGNLIAQGELPDNRHFTEWQDPFKKPSYLFALVAGDLGSISDTFTTMSGRTVALCIYSERHNVDKLSHAMESLKQAMKWDEEKYGREYDLDIFNIVAVDDFNMGAMENKSLNIFNTSCVCASPATATDADFERVQVLSFSLLVLLVQ